MIRSLIRMNNFNAKKLLAVLSSAAMIAGALPSVTTAVQAADTGTVSTLIGDANNDGKVTVADAVAILQYVANKDKYNLEGQLLLNADVYNRGDGVTARDALSIQKYDAKVLTSLPESVMETSSTTPTGTTVSTTATTTGTKPSTTTSATTASTTVSTTGTTTTSTDVTPVADITYIHLNGSSATVTGEHATVNGSVITIDHSGTFYVDGTLDDGQINVNIADEVADTETVKIFLNGASITGKSAPAILITNAENTSINLVDGTENTITDGDTAYAGDYLGAAVIEAKDDLTIKGGEQGTGILNLTANTQDGISCNNDVKFNGGVVNITTLNSTDKTDAVKGKTSVTVKDGTLTIDAEGDGIKSSKGNVEFAGGSTSIKAGNDAVQAATSIDVSGGTVIAGGDRGFTAVEAVNITGGDVYATATDNQVDTKLLAGSTRTVALLNCIDDSTNEKDGMWKKANTIAASRNFDIQFTKKYKYVLISTTDINGAKSCNFFNLGTDAVVTHTDGKQTQFNLGNISVFDNVDPSGGVTSTETDTPKPPAEESTDLTITLDGANIATNAPEDTATVSNGVLTIEKAATFAVTGEGKDAQIIVDVDKSAYPDSVVELDLMGMSLTNTNTAPIYVNSIGDEVQIVAKAGTTNTISDGTTHSQTYTDSDGQSNTVEGAIFSRDDIKFKGTGTLVVNGNQDDAIVCKNDIKIYNGTITVNAVDDGIRGKDSVTIGDSTKSDGSAADNSNLKLTVKTKQGDGIKSTATDTATDKAYGVVTINGGTIDISSYLDGIQAEQEFIMNGGDLNIYTYTGSSGSTTTQQSAPGGGQPGGGSSSTNLDVSAKGIKAVGLYDAAGTTWQSKGNITINGGNITIDSTDDCIHCSGEAVLNAGKLKLASNDDAVHSDASLYIGGKTAGTDYKSLEVYVTTCYEGMEAVYIYQNNGNIYIISRDDGYNAAGGADSSGSNNNTGFGQGGWGGPGGGMGGGSFGEMNLNGGIVSVNTSFQDADGFDSNGNITFNGGYYFGNGGDSFDCGDGGSYSITRKGGYAFGGLGMSGGKAYDMSTQMVFATSDGTVLATSMSGSSMSYAYGDSNVVAYSGAQVTGGENISTLGQPAIYVSGKVSGGTAKTLGQSSSGGGQWSPWG